METDTQQTLNALAAYLSSGIIKGVGRAYARKLVNHFGLGILDVIEKTPQRLTEIPGIGHARISAITAAWQSHRAVAHIMVFLQEKGISPAYAARVYKHYGAHATAVITENPYRLAQDIWGIGFKLADQVAQKMGFALHAVPRVKAGILHVISTEIGYGHLYIKLDKLKSTTCELLGISLLEHGAVIKTALHELYNAATIKLISHKDQHYLTLAQHYATEKGFATRLTAFAARQSPLRDLEFSASTTGAITLNPDQHAGIKAALTHKVTIITGGPGTGKTTLIRQLIDVLESHKLTYKLAAPTGRAAQRITEGTSRPAYTIHRLLEYDVRSMGFRHHEQFPLELDFLIIDESSMIDIFLAHAIVKALPATAHLVFIGDADQLPSVGPGAVLNDLILSQAFATVRLTHIFRQAQHSLIVVNAHRIQAGEFPTSAGAEGRRDFIFIKEDAPQNITTQLNRIYESTIGPHGLYPEDVTVLCPMHKGPAGTQALNQHLQSLLNSQSPRQLNGPFGTIFKMGDKVMQLKNNYSKNIFNGDSGIIEEIDYSSQSLMVNFDERLVEYGRDDFDELTLAYSISVHKSQGSEYPAVIIPLFMQHFMLLERNLLYTAVTRAKKLCILIGQTKAVAIAIRNTKSSRATFLREFLSSDLASR
jgi:exodeoxyribonuclease V alpha subunit